jgi:oligopeptide transport system substrate-binding protein
MKRLFAFLCFVWLNAAGALAADLRVALPSWPTTFDPQRALTRVEHLLAREVFTGLTTFDSAGKIVPGLAESWAVSPDGLVYTFVLRRDLKWSNGVDLEARDVVRGLERALDPATAAPLFAQLLLIQNAEEFRLGTLASSQKLAVTAIDRRTVEIRLATASQRFLQVLAQPVATPAPDPRTSAAATPQIISNGPFMVDHQAEGHRLIKNPYFFDASSVGASAIDIVLAPRLNAALAAEDIDLALAYMPEPRVGRATNPALIDGEGRDLIQLTLNVTRAPLNSRELRHALGMLIDRAELIKDLHLINAEPAFNMVPDPPYNAFRAPYARLNRGDRAIVAEALLLDVDIPALRSLKFLHPDELTHAALAQAVAAAWRAVGFKVDLVAVPDASYEAVLLSGDFDVAMAVPWRASQATDSFLWPHTQAAGPWNVSNYREPEFEQMMKMADEETLTDAYPSHLRQAEGVLIEDQVALPLVFFPVSVLARTKIPGLVPNAAHIHPLRYLSPP